MRHPGRPQRVCRRSRHANAAKRPPYLRRNAQTCSYVTVTFGHMSVRRLPLRRTTRTCWVQSSGTGGADAIAVPGRCAATPGLPGRPSAVRRYGRADRADFAPRLDADDASRARPGVQPGCKVRISAPTDRTMRATTSRAAAERATMTTQQIRRGARL